MDKIKNNNFSSFTRIIMTILLQMSFTILYCQNVDKTINLLKTSDDVITKINAIETLGELKDSRAIMPLITSCKEHELYYFAIQALVGFGNKAVDPLIIALKDSTSIIRSSAADALGQIGDQRAVIPLINLINDTIDDVRFRAAQALCLLNDNRAIVPLRTLLNDHSSDVKIEVMKFLGKIKDTASVKPLCHILLNEKIGAFAALALEQIGDSRAVVPLIAALDIGGWELDEYGHLKYGYVTRSAAHALGIFADKRATIPLINYLNNLPKIDYAEQMNAVFALGEIKDTIAFLPISRLLCSNHSQVRESAIEALVKIGDKRAIYYLENDLLDWERGKEIVNPLLLLGWIPETKSDSVHLLIAQRNGVLLKQKWAQTKEVLLADISSNNSIAINNALFAFICIGENEIISDLVKILNEKGTKLIAEAYLNCGNNELAAAAKQWASKHGFSISSSSQAYHPSGWGVW